MAGKVPPRPQASKRNRTPKSVPVRAHERTFTDKPKPRPKTLAERFRGSR